MVLESTVEVLLASLIYRFNIVAYIPETFTLNTYMYMAFFFLYMGLLYYA